MFVFFILASFLCNVLLVEGNIILGSHESEYPKAHLKFMRNIEGRQVCHVQNKTECKKLEKVSKRCWGYELGCLPEYVFQYPVCDKLLVDRRMKLEEYIQHFWVQAGFGYVKKEIDTINVFCQPIEKHDSSLKCSQKWHYCEATNIYMDFRKIEFSTHGERYKEDVFKGNGDIGGVCRLNKDLMDKPVKYNKELSSWNAELRSYSMLNSNPFNTGGCDEIINKTTIFMKLDSGVNMYHHFCDFLNLYISQHIYGSFSTDVYIVNWDTSITGYYDMFSDTWNAFSKHLIKPLQTFAGKKMCFRNAVFSLLPRMINGLYYNTPLFENCRGGGLLRAFSEHVLHRLGISQSHYNNDVIRVTFLKRSTKYRNILNEDELISAMKKMHGLNVSVVDYKHKEIDFLEQLKMTHHSDIFIAIHGAGLTHMIFQPSWGAVFELYNTEDEQCYMDLARIRGLSYFTWEKKELLHQEDKGISPQHPDGHPKFTNYAFNVKEFERLLTRAINVVKIKRPKLPR